MAAGTRQSGPRRAPRRWVVVFAVAGSILFLVLAIMQFNADRPVFGWGLILAAVLCSGGYALQVLSGDRLRHKR